jgi:hypothetical protein
MLMMLAYIEGWKVIAEVVNIAQTRSRPAPTIKLAAMYWFQRR